METKLPLRIQRYINLKGYAIYGPDTIGCVAERWEKEATEEREKLLEEYAAFIVRACNSHAALLAALKGCIRDLEGMPKSMGFKYTSVRAAKAAISLASEETGQAGER